MKHTVLVSLCLAGRVRGERSGLKTTTWAHRLRIITLHNDTRLDSLVLLVPGKGASSTLMGADTTAAFHRDLIRVLDPSREHNDTTTATLKTGFRDTVRQAASQMGSNGFGEGGVPQPPHG